MRVRLIAGAIVLGLSVSVSAAAASGIWLDVPFVEQQKNGCGAAAISMVMQYWARQHTAVAERDADAAVIQHQLYSAEAGGIYASAMKAYFREHGFRTFDFRGEWSDLKEHLAKGRPLIVALKPGRTSMHYVVVTGIDWENHLVMVNDPAQRKLLKVGLREFEHEWSGADHWTLLAIPQPTAR